MSFDRAFRPIYGQRQQATKSRVITSVNLRSNDAVLPSVVAGRCLANTTTTALNDEFDRLTLDLKFADDYKPMEVKIDGGKLKTLSTQNKQYFAMKMDPEKTAPKTGTFLALNESKMWSCTKSARKQCSAAGLALSRSTWTKRIKPP